MTDRSTLMAEGREAATQDSYACPYVSGQRIRSWWRDGFVEQCYAQRFVPEGTPMYLRGRIAFLYGVEGLDLPADETFTGRWFSGYMDEKERFERGECEHD